jgi:signal transduction histidine kinase
LIFKESVNNLVKYADATMVEMSAHIENNSLVMKVKDNGKGFVLTEESAATGSFVSEKDYDGFGGNGLINMRRRAESLGGSFLIESEKGAGTSIKIRIPI